MKKAFSISLILFIFIASCKKDEDVQPEQQIASPGSTNYYYLDSSIIPFKFKPGSYWIYVNDSTGVLDSIAIDSISTGFINVMPPVHGDPNRNYNEIYKMFIHDFGNARYYTETLFDNSLLRNFGPMAGGAGYTAQPLYRTNNPVGTYWPGGEITAKLLTMTVNANTFNNVGEVKITVADLILPEFATDSYLYYTDTIGLIKKEFLLSPVNIESWSIIRWNVIK